MTKRSASGDAQEKQIIEEHESTQEHDIRVEKALSLRKQGIEPWPAFKPVNATASQVLSEYTPGSSREYSVAGRLMARREHGKSAFGVVQDRTGKIQIYCKQDLLGEQLFEFFVKHLDVGDIVWVKGTTFTTKTGETTLQVHELTLLSKCLYPLPEKFHGLTDVEIRYRQRYLDLIVNEESRKKFMIRSKLMSEIRHFLEQSDFVEVETPMLHPIPGGAAARPFVTRHNALGSDFYLRIAPELYMKRLDRKSTRL